MSLGLGIVAEIVRVLGVLPLVEGGRLREGPAGLVPALRARGRTGRRRSEAERENLRRAIGLVDRIMPGGGNCYRRVLLELALDRDAAAAPVHLGLRREGGPRSGHAWLLERDRCDRYDVEFLT